MPASSNWYAFPHALLREVVYQLQLPTDRARLHRLALEEGEADLSALELARHARAAREADDDPALAVQERDWLRAALKQAERRYQVATIPELLARLIEISPETERAELRLQLAVHWRDVGRMAEAEGVLKPLAASISGAPGEAHLRTRVLGALAGVLIRTGRLPEAEAMCRERIQTAPDNAGAADAQGMLGVALHHQGKLTEAEQAYRSALKLSEHGGSQAGTNRFRANLALLLSDTGHQHEAETQTRIALDQARRDGDLMLQGTLLGNFALLLTNVARYPEAEPMYREALEINLRSGHRPGYGVALMNLGRLLRLQRRYAEAEPVFTQAIQIHREVSNPGLEGITLAHLGDMYVSQGRLAEASKALHHAVALLRGTSDRLYTAANLGALSRLQVLQGNLADARDTIDEARSMVPADAPLPFLLNGVLLPAMRLVAAEAALKPIPIARKVAELHSLAEQLEAVAGSDPDDGAVAEMLLVLHELDEAARENRPSLVIRGWHAQHMSPELRRALTRELSELEQGTLRLHNPALAAILLEAPGAG